MACAKCGIKVPVSDWLAEPLILDRYRLADKWFMPILGPQREAPFCSEGGRLVLVTSREGDGVTGAIFPTGARRWPWLSRWASWSAFRWMVGLCLEIVECRPVGRTVVGRPRTGKDAWPLPGGSRCLPRPLVCREGSAFPGTAVCRSLAAKPARAFQVAGASFGGRVGLLPLPKLRWSLATVRSSWSLLGDTAGAFVLSCCLGCKFEVGWNGVVTLVFNFPFSLCWELKEGKEGGESVVLVGLRKTLSSRVFLNYWKY